MDVNELFPGKPLLICFYLLLLSCALKHPVNGDSLVTWPLRLERAGRLMSATLWSPLVTEWLSSGPYSLLCKKRTVMFPSRVVGSADLSGAYGRAAWDTEDTQHCWVPFVCVNLDPGLRWAGGSHTSSRAVPPPMSECCVL